MEENNKVQLFENQSIRTAWDEENEEWFFSIVDVIKVLTESRDPSAYWRKLKQRLTEEGNGNRDKLSRFENEGRRWEKKNDGCSKYRTTFAFNSIHSIEKSRAI